MVQFAKGQLQGCVRGRCKHVQGVWGLCVFRLLQPHPARHPFLALPTTTQRLWHARLEMLRFEIWLRHMLLLALRETWMLLMWILALAPTQPGMSCAPSPAKKILNEPQKQVCEAIDMKTPAKTKQGAVPWQYVAVCSFHTATCTPYDITNIVSLYILISITCTYVAKWSLTLKTTALLLVEMRLLMV